MIKETLGTYQPGGGCRRGFCVVSWRDLTHGRGVGMPCNIVRDQLGTVGDSDQHYCDVTVKYIIF